MSEIYAGNESKVDNQVLDQLKRLPDDFFALTEFAVPSSGRDIDCLLVRVRDDAPASLIVTELKHANRPLKGSANGEWQKLDDHGEFERIPNFYHQVVSASNSLKDWLWNTQSLFRENGWSCAGRDSFKIWPNLLILSPLDVRKQHRFPIVPETRFGRWWFDIEDWLRHVRDFGPSPKGSKIVLSPSEVRKLAVDCLNLKKIWPPGVTLMTANASSSPEPPSEPGAFLRALEKRMAGVETIHRELGVIRHRVRILELKLSV